MNTSSKVNLATIAVAAFLLFLGDRFRNPMLILSAFWLPSWRALARKPSPETNDPNNGSAWLPWDMFLLPLLITVCFLCQPLLSDDFHRYLWEGHVQNQGYSPYNHAPRSLYPLLDHPSEGKINHDELTAIYPPLAQLLFRLSDLLSTSIYAWKGLILLLLGLWVWFEPRARTPLILLSPLILIEGLWHAHLDVIGLLPGFLLVRTLLKRLPLGAGAALAAMVGLKIVPIVLAPICFLYFRGSEKIRFALALAGLLFLIYLPFLDQAATLFDSFLRFSREWHFNNPFFHAFMLGFGRDAARVILGLGLLAWLGFATFRQAPVEHKCATAWIGVLAFSPTLYPWYLLWLLPFIAAGKLKYLHLGYLATCLSYLVLVEYQTMGIWRERFSWMIPEWLILLFCFFMLMRQPEPSPVPSSDTG